MDRIRAYRIHETDGVVRAGLEELRLEDLTPGEVVIRSCYSSVNYKDALAATGEGKILRRSPLVGGIDVAGVVAASEDPRFRKGDRVVVTGCGLGESQDGGFSEAVRVPADWVVPLPANLSLYDAMAMGTAGFTAALAIDRLEQNGLAPDQGPVLVTGATGGVGSLAVDLLDGRGYEVVALTGKTTEETYLRGLGASRVLVRDDLVMGTRPLEQAQWAGAVDNAGGALLAWLTRTVRPWGSIASIGMAGGIELDTTVMPFILRGVSILGITSVTCPMPRRRRIWQGLAGDLGPRHLDAIVSGVIGLGELPAVFKDLLSGQHRGRTVVQLTEAD
ncbi:MAG: oxidoreductase [Gammaproteobacteria bacterium]|nr:MAG: oxidoreductase [Gammaproteobacteria bacterium]